MKIVLISTYALGQQPFGLASPHTWLKNAGFEVSAHDCSISPFPEHAVKEARLIAFYLPMHTATQLSIPLIKRSKKINPNARICAYGLYAILNEDILRDLGISHLIGGEFELPLLKIAQDIAKSHYNALQPSIDISTARQQFQIPDRDSLPSADQYAQLIYQNRKITTGYVEASRGCKHQCSHCPIVPVYNGRFRIVQKDIVLADIAQQVEKGAQHITFGDPDFLNGPKHVLEIVEAMHRQFPGITYDVTIKVEHILKYHRHLNTLKETGCLFVTSAVEAVSDEILEILKKGHTRADLIEAIDHMRGVGLSLKPTLVTFTPWISRQGYADLLAFIAEHGLIDAIAPIQLAIRLLLPNKSPLLDHPKMKPHLQGFNAKRLGYDWQHPDPTMDHFQDLLMKLLQQNYSSRDFFKIVCEKVETELQIPLSFKQAGRILDPCNIPYLTEPWYC